ncbi:MAG: SDR family oxidoreductase [Gammaproteobacteria bacterium]|nr:SDR family oxidoreductase [Gammaproteobacteria bacterium]
MQVSMQGRTALITGGSQGLGYAMAKRFLESGAQVAILARRQDVLDEARTELEATTGGSVLAQACDVSDAVQIERAHAAVVAELGPVDILVNNAGAASTGAFEDVTDAMWQADLDLKLFAAIRLSRLVLPGMKERRFGRIINLLNTAAKAPPANSAPTSVSRAAGLALTKVLANEGAPHNVLVNALLIGLIKSEQVKRWWQATDGNQSLEEHMEKVGSRLPMGRMGEAEECANLACFLASEQGSYVTGCAINMDGGLSPVP